MMQFIQLKVRFVAWGAVSLLFILSAAIFPCMAAASFGDPMAACRAAAAQAEQEAGLPAGLLLAIGQQESGRWDFSRGKVMPWPFATNAAGESRFFQTSAEAIGHVVTEQRAGIQSIDVGCFQINLHHHPDAFPTLEAAFDPLANARYAARFLLSLHAETGSWEAAVGRYHSATASLGEPYAAAVFNFWHHRPADGLPTVQVSEPWRQVVAGVIVQRPGADYGSGVSVSRVDNLPRVITPTTPLPTAGRF